MAVACATAAPVYGTTDVVGVEVMVTLVVVIVETEDMDFGKWSVTIFSSNLETGVFEVKESFNGRGYGGVTYRGRFTRHAHARRHCLGDGGCGRHRNRRRRGGCDGGGEGESHAG